MNIYTLYWLFKPDYQDPYTEGYVGITKHLNQRIIEHRRTFSDFEVKVLAEGTFKEVLNLENQYRKEPFVGWNKAIGGFYGGCPPGGNWYTNGTESKMIFSEDKIPDGFVKGRHKGEWRKVLSESMKGVDTYVLKTEDRKKGLNNYLKKNYLWYNNGEENLRVPSKEQPPEGFIRGRLLECPKNFTTKNKTCYNDGTRNIFIKEGEEIPEGFVKGMRKKDGYRRGRTQKRKAN